MTASPLDPFFFGYGSLVNRQTHDYPNCAPTKVRGWRRAWRRSGARRWCYLTAVPCDQTELWGLRAAVTGADWQALDLREAAYDRHLVPQSHSNAPADAGLSIYAIAPAAQGKPQIDSPVLLSYLDVVVQGYLREFGPEGVTHFFETTEGWDAPILDDRAAPFYPRHQRLSDAERNLVDTELARVSAHIFSKA